ncbi:hypothetical protein HPB50_020012 [Hyalomma asiaticum]|uniref:Uncharacterized protein n=1 Tax=Hyalomma asiaticum TaxID=266040 RepID=A0ACB7RQW1_HYAAI|nr:hypothetical protein HPB50_020012 [Hyalomma asiaticum]
MFCSVFKKQERAKASPALAPSRCDGRTPAEPRNSTRTRNVNINPCKTPKTRSSSSRRVKHWPRSFLGCGRMHRRRLAAQPVKRTRRKACLLVRHDCAEKETMVTVQRYCTERVQSQGIMSTSYFPECPWQNGMPPFAFCQHQCGASTSAAISGSKLPAEPATKAPVPEASDTKTPAKGADGKGQAGGRPSDKGRQEEGTRRSGQKDKGWCTVRKIHFDGSFLDHRRTEDHKVKRDEKYPKCHPWSMGFNIPKQYDHHCASDVLEVRSEHFHQDTDCQPQAS